MPKQITHWLYHDYVYTIVHANACADYIYIYILYTYDGMVKNLLYVTTYEDLEYMSPLSYGCEMM